MLKFYMKVLKPLLEVEARKAKDGVHSSQILFAKTDGEPDGSFSSP